MKKLLIHTCCAPCFTYFYEDLTNLKEVFKQNIEFSSYFYNPNIHPKFEFNRRLDTLKKYCNDKEIDLIIDDSYNMKDFVSNCLKYNNRCDYCYMLRLEGAFKCAKENGFDSVMTTLSISPYQNQKLIKKIGSELSEKYNIEYIHLDYTVKFREGQRIAINEGLYRQKYCGCVLSMDAREVGILNE